MAALNLEPEQLIIIGLAIIIVVLIALWEMKGGLPVKKGIEITPETLLTGLDRPVLWVFYNTSDVNSRNWADFGARSSRVINIPLLNLCYETIVAQNGADYRIEVIGGLERVAELLGGWEKLPSQMRYSKARVTRPEEDWIRAAVLAKYGGLWLSPSVVCLKPFGTLSKEVPVFFGQDQDPMYGSAIPGFNAVWIPAAGKQMMSDWEARCRSRLEWQLGGRQTRGDAKSDWIELSKQYAVEVKVLEELSRDPKTNMNLDLEQIFSSGGKIEVPKSAIYLVIPYNNLLDRRLWGWVLRSSEEQLMASDLAIIPIIKAGLSSQMKQ
jgi:hypothetical protein